MGALVVGGGGGGRSTNFFSIFFFLGLGVVVGSILVIRGVGTYCLHSEFLSWCNPTLARNIEFLMDNCTLSNWRSLKRGLVIYS